MGITAEGIPSEEVFGLLRISAGLEGIQVAVGGQFKPIYLGYISVGGIWKELERTYVKRDGVWVEL